MRAFICASYVMQDSRAELIDNILLCSCAASTQQCQCRGRTVQLYNKKYTGAGSLKYLNYLVYAYAALTICHPRFGKAQLWNETRKFFEVGKGLYARTQIRDFLCPELIVGEVRIV